MSKRISLVGNMNNNFFALTCYLRDAGYDAHLFYRLAMEHFQPQADSYDDKYVSYCHQVNWLDNGFHNVDKELVKAQLSGFDFYIGQGEEAAVANVCGFNMNVYYPYGSDVYKYAQLPAEYRLISKLAAVVIRDGSRPTLKQMMSGTMAKYLRGAIVNADYIFADPTNDAFEKELQKLGYKGRYEPVPMPFIYTKEYEGLLKGFVPESPAAEQVQQLRQQYDFILLYHGRQEWKTYHNYFTVKNTHHLIAGFAKYIKAHPNSKAGLAMLEYGSDVEPSKQLIADLGITEYVHWFPKMYRKDLMYLVYNSDLCSGEFNHSYLTFGTVIEAMLMKKPVITYRQDDLYTGVYPRLYPCYNARETEEIVKAITDAVSNPEKRKQMGEEANEWVELNFIQKPLTRLIEIIEAR